MFSFLGLYICICFLSNAYSTDIVQDEINLSSYEAEAKSVQTKKLSDADIVSLSNSAEQCLKILEETYLAPSNLQKDKIKIIFNVSTEDNYSKFLKSACEIYNLLNYKNIKKIVAKSPLEIVCLIRDIELLLKLITATPEKYGCNIQKEKIEDKVAITITTNSINNIFKTILKLNQYKKRKMFRKVSRIISYMMAEEKDINKIIDNLSRSTIDNKRVTLYVSVEK
ncbi:MAG: hypothetical protein IJ481_02155 [Alphaproteobacteria bacterium]|nr:hypothetical protein [Alphaproteobacteria bacterium]